jgi:hypothetical protein
VTTIAEALSSANARTRFFTTDQFPSAISMTSLQIPMPDGVKPPPRSQFVTEFAFGDRVQIDGDNDLKGRVTGFWWTAPEIHTIEVTWLANGDVKTAWFSSWRLTRSP